MGAPVSLEQNVMITGDNPLTACHIAKEVSIVEKVALILDSKDNIDHPTKVEGRGDSSENSELCAAPNIFLRLFLISSCW